MPSTSYHSLFSNWISFKLPRAPSQRKTPFQYRHHHLASFSPTHTQADYIQVSCIHLHIKSNNGIPLHPHTHTLRLVLLFTEVCESVPLSEIPVVWYYLPWSGKLFPSKSNMRNKCCFPRLKYRVQHQLGTLPGQSQMSMLSQKKLRKRGIGSKMWFCNQQEGIQGSTPHKVRFKIQSQARTSCQGWFLTGLTCLDE